MGAGLPTISKGRFWLYVAAAVPVEMILINASRMIDNPYNHANQRELLVVAISLIVLFVLIPALIAWLVGRFQRS